MRHIYFDRQTSIYAVNFSKQIVLHITHSFPTESPRHQNDRPKYNLLLAPTDFYAFYSFDILPNSR